MNETAIIYFDGGSRGNPGAAAGAAIIEWQGEKHKDSRYIPHATSNEAEYTGLIIALQKALELGIQQAKIYGDSQLVVNQVNGAWNINKPHLYTLCAQARSLLAQLNKYELLWIPRSENTLADAAVNQCINGVSLHNVIMTQKLGEG